MTNGYKPSIMQPLDDQWRCYICGRSDQKLDRHEIFGGAFREKSKRHGLWVCLCHDRCHLYGVHRFPERYRWLKEEAQKKAMEHYGWTIADWRVRYGRNYVEENNAE